MHHTIEANLTAQDVIYTVAYTVKHGRNKATHEARHFLSHDAARKEIEHITWMHDNAPVPKVKYGKPHMIIGCLFK